MKWEEELIQMTRIEERKLAAKSFKKWLIENYCDERDDTIIYQASLRFAQIQNEIFDKEWNLKLNKE